MPKTYTESKAAYVCTIMEPEHESNNTAVLTVDVLKQVAISLSRELVYKINAAAVSTVYMLEPNLCGYRQTLVNRISSAKRHVIVQILT